VLLFVCVAAYLNWSYNKNSDSGETVAEASPLDTEGSVVDQGASASGEDAGLYYQEEVSYNKEYFDSARLNRQQARDAAAAALATVSKTEGASQEMIDTALQEISEIASVSVKEAQIEDLIKAKGFADCVVYISEADVNITVPAPPEGLAASSVAKITDIVVTQTDYKATDLKINEIK
jgi:stage III sporulation protein AH